MLSRRRLAIVAVAVVAAAAALVWYLNRGRDFGADEAIAALPQSAGATVFVDVDRIRAAGILDMIAGTKAAEDLEYREFVSGTGFDYRRDLRTVAASFSGGDAFFVLRGRFDWSRIERYAKAQGADCKGALCRLRSARSGRWMSFYRLRGNALAIAFSTNQSAALDIAPRKDGITPRPDTGGTPVWAVVTPASLRGAALPAGTQSFASPLVDAETILFSLGPGKQGLELKLDVTCGSASAASDLLVRLEAATNMLRKLIERERLKPNPGDLSGLLTSGVFRREDRRVYGWWPVPNQLVQGLASGSGN